MTTALAKEDERIELLRAERAVSYLRKLAESLKCEKDGGETKTKEDAVGLFKKPKKEERNRSKILLVVLRTIFLAQAKIVEFLNSSSAKCGVAVHAPSMMPSPASMLADLKKYLEFFAHEDEFASVIILSFFRPVPVKNEQIYCACGSENKIRFVSKKTHVFHSAI
jgi:hypothetical protein